MTTLEMLSREDAEQERQEQLQVLGTTDREKIRADLLDGMLDDKHASAARRLATLDYLLG